MTFLEVGIMIKGEVCAMGDEVDIERCGAIEEEAERGCVELL